VLITLKSKLFCIAELYSRLLIILLFE